MSSNLLVLFTRTFKEVPPGCYENYLKMLPHDVREKNRRFMRWEDRSNHLFGQLLLGRGFKHFGFCDKPWGNIRYNGYGRPHYPGGIDFNISHSGNIVACAFCVTSRVGLDVEKVVPVDFSDFEPVMTGEQWNSIYSAPDPFGLFFDYWTIKESVIKADSRGLSIPLQSIRIFEHNALVESHAWYIRRLHIDKKFRAHIATDSPIASQPEVNEVFFDI